MANHRSGEPPFRGDRLLWIVLLSLLLIWLASFAVTLLRAAP